jgi:hypothetical protein
MPSQHGVIMASVDGRGTGKRGNKLMHSTYKKIGQFEKEDASDFAKFLLEQVCLRFFCQFSYHLI